MEARVKPAYYRIKDLTVITGMSVSTIYSWMAQGTFPRPVQLGPRAVGWRAEDIDAWKAQRPGTEHGG
ncbi:MAG: AlpA family transcriptional regulator [Chloroflexi bacterium]|nr:AlpA family transcriptional regulator [Chloroflexota bacterium]